MTEKLYHVEKNCGDILVYISSVVQKKYWIKFETLGFLV